MAVVAVELAMSGADGDASAPLAPGKARRASPRRAFHVGARSARQIIPEKVGNKTVFCRSPCGKARLRSEGVATKETHKMSIANLQDQNNLIRASNRSGGLFQIFPARTGESGSRMAGTEDNHQRFARLVLPHLGDAYSLARWITGNRADAEDVVQDASLRAFRAIGSVAEGNSRAWVLTIVRNSAYTWLKKNRPLTLMGVDDLEAVESVQVVTDLDRETPETALIAKTDAASLEAAIAELPPTYRETLILRDVQGLGYREISQVTDVPIGTVMSRLARARARVIKTIGRV
jgi:RNA polymerase sigma-70 factor (ECF subfamily)